MSIVDKEFYVYTLRDCRGNVAVKVVDDCSDNLTIGGYDAKGDYKQYDSYEAYHAYDWAAKHGFELLSQKHVIKVNDSKTGVWTHLSETYKAYPNG